MYFYRQLFNLGDLNVYSYVAKIYTYTNMYSDNRAIIANTRI